MKQIRLSKLKGKKYKGKNLGLHCHCAEKKEKLLELLERAKKENVSYLVINNYRSLQIFTRILSEISEQELEPYKNIKLIPSIEMPVRFNFTNVDGINYNIEAHILGYGVDLSKEKLLEEFCKKNYKSINQEEELQRLIKIGHELGLHFNDEDAFLDPNDDNRKFAGRAFVQALMKYMDDNFCSENEENINKLPYELRTNWRAFQNRCVKDINSPFFFDMTSLNASVEKVIDLIHQMGGKVYLGHPSSYFAKVGSQEDIDKAFQNTVKLFEDFIKQYSPKTNPQTHIDGGEIYHPSYLGNIEVINEIRELIKAHRLASSGGTDIHVDDTTGENEKVSSDSLGGNVTKSKLRKFRLLRRKAVNIFELRQKVIELKNNDFEK